MSEASTNQIPQGRIDELRRHFIGKQVRVKITGNAKSEFTNGTITYIRFESPEFSNQYNARIIFGFAWDGKPDKNSEHGIELIWGLDEIELAENQS